MIERQQEALRWLQFAEEDLEQACEILEQEAFIPRHPCWLAQQAAEKSLKAVLVSASIEFPRTHDLDHLRMLVPDSYTVNKAQVDWSDLSEYAVDTRYPGDWPDIGANDAQTAVKDAATVVAQARHDLEVCRT